MNRQSTGEGTRTPKKKLPEKLFGPGEMREMQVKIRHPPFMNYSN